MPRTPDSRLTIHTTWGPIRVTVRDGAVRACELPMVGDDVNGAPRIKRVESSARSRADSAVLRGAARFVRAALKGKSVAAPPLAHEGVAPFTAACRRAMRQLKPGRTISYAELARRAGSPDAARGAGQACARNPFPLFIPCHRVLASRGRLGGYSAGLRWKVHLLDVESRR